MFAGEKVRIRNVGIPLPTGGLGYHDLDKATGRVLTTDTKRQVCFVHVDDMFPSLRWFFFREVERI